AVEAVRARLEAAGVVARKLATTHAFHSPMMAPAVEPLAELVGRMTLRAPSIPLVSNVTGTWITPAEAVDPRYWARHLREPVRFDRGAAELLRGPGRILLEVGPGQTLSTFVRQAGEAAAGVPAIPSLRYPYDRTPDISFLFGALGRLWLAGAAPEWEAFHAGERLNRVPLPTYPWERQRYWVEAPSGDGADARPIAMEKRADPASWAHLPSWRRSPAVRAAAGEGRVLVFADDSALSAAVLDELRRAGREMAIVRPGEHFAASGDAFTVRPGSREDHRKLADALADAGGIPAAVLHLWGATGEGEARGGFGAVVLADALGRREKAELVAVSAGMAEVTGAEALEPVRAGLLGALPVLALEYPSLTVRAVDVETPRSEDEARALASRIAAEALSGRTERVVALRGRSRWVRGWDAVPAADLGPVPLREGGVYLFVGGLRGRNERLAEHLVRTRGARLALIDPTLPHRGQWDAVVRARLAEDPLRRQIERVRELEAGGAGVLTIQVIPSEVQQLRDALRLVDERFGALHGVVVSPLAHEVEPVAAVSELRLAEWEKRAAHLFAELGAIEEALEGRALDFVVLESSLTPALGGIGLAGLAATHAMTDAFAQRHARASSLAWTSAGWDRWLGEGESAEGFGMTREEAGAAFETLLALAGEPAVLLSTGDLARRAERSAAPAESAAGGTMYARPTLATEYHPPASELEERVAGIWEEMLGISPIGIHDDFFGLGGHSLLATQIISRVRDSFALELPLKTIFEAPTVARFSAVIEAELMAEIDAMSADEILSIV
ncbi:MAG TPA: phosphopantetheine-binding protein, partial [Longimicrobium sp.]|nr:phosphopantetheine-binding protein [Longimicrobium sp.]